MKAVGWVKEVNLYPVKSMRGTSVREATLYWYGLNGDRKYAFVRSGTRSGFPWLTGREMPELLQYEPQFVSIDEPMRSDICVKTPSEQVLPLESPELKQTLTAEYSEDISLLRLNRGTYDAMPVSLMTENTLERLGHNLNEPLDPRRFRANLILQTESMDDEPEGGWMNALLTFGERPDSAEIRVSHRTKRCVMINLEPDTGEHSANILKEVAKTMQACAGVYGTVSKLGSIKVGDAVYLEHNGS